MIDEKTRLELIAEARRTVKETNFCADLCFRLTERGRFAIDQAKRSEQAKLRDMSRRFIAKHGRPKRDPLPPGHTAEIICLPFTRRQRT